MDIKKNVERVIDTVVAFRRYIHENAELSMQEVKTTQRIVDELKKIPGIEIQTFDKHTGVVALLRGAKPGKTLALRGDIDALPMKEETGLPFASKTNVCHSCGHDMHATVLLGTAMVLSGMRDSINGTVKFLFQPGEETLSGARSFIDSGVMENPKIDAIMGLHVWPFTPVGTVAFKTGASMASADTLDITVTGRSGHAAYPHRAIDSVYITSQVINALQSIVSRELNSLDSVVVSIGQIHGGTARNIIAESVSLEGTVRTLNPEIRKNMPQIIERIVSKTAEAFNGSATVSYTNGTPVLVNDAAILSVAQEAARQVLGDDKVLELENPVMGGEDFAFFMETVPGVFFRLGTTTDDPATHFAAHNPKTIFDEGAIPVGISVMTQAALNYLR